MKQSMQKAFCADNDNNQRQTDSFATLSFKNSPVYCPQADKTLLFDWHTQIFTIQ